ncbi:MAG: hypothetical protein MRK02_16885 [Candidatus Scalindua sp.]|nr:hypothetical protein [Candidatus Scalindua sp.]
MREQNQGEREWYLDKSKEPHHKPGKINKELEQAIVESRKKLVTRDRPSTKYSFCGAIAIHQELDTLGYQEKPGLSTINRVLKRNDLIIEKSRHKNETTSGKYYPTIKTKHPGHVHQL